MLAHSTFLTIATEFAAKARGVAMSLVAFCFMVAVGFRNCHRQPYCWNSSFLTCLLCTDCLLVLNLAVLMVKKSFVIQNVQQK